MKMCGVATAPNFVTRINIINILRQSSMVGSIQVYYLVFFLSLAMMPLIFFMRTPRRRALREAMPVME